MSDNVVDFQSPADRLRALIEAAARVVIFTGAGISTESGIPDFRSPGGLWSKYQPIEFSDFMASEEMRRESWRRKFAMEEVMTRAEPNRGHRAVEKLVRNGKVTHVVTQNIDGLHQLAGSQQVIEIHGTARVIACIACGKEWSPPDVHAMIEAGDDAPDCDECGSPLKSKTISFGQAMPEKEMREAAELTKAADLYLAIGSSLVVEPAASLPRMAKKYGATLVIINKTPTPLDPYADLVINESIGETLQAAVRDQM